MLFSAISIHTMLMERLGLQPLVSSSLQSSLPLTCFLLVVGFYGVLAGGWDRDTRHALSSAMQTPPRRLLTLIFMPLTVLSNHRGTKVGIA